MKKISSDAIAVFPAEINLQGDRCGGTDNKSGNLAKKRTVSLLLLSSSLCFGGGLTSLVIRKSCLSTANYLSTHSSLK
jgi:hypothetical protein